MTADIRMALENELDHLDETQVESWIERCFESCDPRYDSDWLNGIFELALMQYPDNYEVRGAASRAATMEAQRLFDEGDCDEAVARLERLLESDPYCTEAFEMLERFTAVGDGVSAEPVDPPMPAWVESAAPTPAPLAEVTPLADQPDELLSFLDDDLLAGLSSPLSPPEEEVQPSQEPVFASTETPPAPAVEAAVEAPVEVAPSLTPPPEVPVAPQPEPVHLAAPVAPPAAPVAPPAAPVAPPAAPVAPQPVPAPVAARPALQPPPDLPDFPISTAPTAAPVARHSPFDWRSVVGLPGHAQPKLEPQLEAILPSLTERFSQVGNYRSLVLLLTDLYQRDPSHQGVSNNLNSVLRDWATQLEKQGRGQEAGQVAAWSQQLLGEKANWAPVLLARFPAQPPNLPDLGNLASLAAPNWMSWVNLLRDDPARFHEAGQALASDPQGLQSLCRHLAVQHPDHPEHVLNLGWAYSHTGQHALAMVHTQRSLQMKQSARGYQLLHQVYTDLGQPEMAQRVAQQLTQLRG